MLLKVSGTGECACVRACVCGSLLCAGLQMSTESNG